MNDDYLEEISTLIPMNENYLARRQRHKMATQLAINLSIIAEQERKRESQGARKSTDRKAVKKNFPPPPRKIRTISSDQLFVGIFCKPQKVRPNIVSISPLADVG